MPNVIGRGVEALKKFIKDCKNAGGVPIVRTRYGGRRLNFVVATCWGMRDVVRGGAIVDVPSEIIDALEKARVKYKYLETLAG
jgi:hypothetical protein